MNVFNKVALQGIRKSHARTLVTIIGAALSAAMITAVATLGVSLLDYMVRGAVSKYGDWHVAFINVDSKFVQEQRNNKETVRTAVFQNTGYAMLEGGKNPDKPYLFIAGYGDETFNVLPVNLMSGRLPENSSEILVSGSVAANGGVSYMVGDKITLAVGRRMSGEEELGQHDPYRSGKETLVSLEEKTYTVTGICQRPSFEERSAAGYTLITKMDTQNQTDSLSLFAKLKKPQSAMTYADSTANGSSYIFNDNVLRFMGASSQDKIFNMLLYSVGIIVVVIIMAGSVFLIYNTFNISVNERMHQSGILMSVGATARQLRGMVLFEGLCIAVAGIPLGILAGIGIIGSVLPFVSENFNNVMYDSVPLELVVSVPALAAAAAASLVTILISAYIPAHKAAKTPVMECIRQTNEVMIEAKNVKTSKTLQRIYGLEGTLALKNFKRNKKRYRSIVLSLILSIVLFITVSSFVTELQQTSERAVVYTNYNIGFATKDMEDDKMLALFDKLKTADGVYNSSYQAVMTYYCNVKASSLSDAFRKELGLKSPDETARLIIDVQFLEDSVYMGYVKKLGLPEKEYTGPDSRLLSVAKIAINNNRMHEADEFLDMFAASSMDLNIIPGADGAPAQGKDISVEFASYEPCDILPDPARRRDNNYMFVINVPYSRKAEFDASGGIVDMKGITFCSKQASQSVSAIEKIIMGESIVASYTIYNLNKLMEENTNMIFIANVFAYIFIVMISLIAVANVFNTISTNIRLRRRELAMLRSVGMSDRDFNKMMRFECMFYGIRALLYGLPLSIFISWLVYQGMLKGGADGIDFIIPWAAIGISIFSVLFVIFITMMYAVSKIKKENIIDALRDDML
ncbi:MAG TPA: ABC transporter permease [Lachnospiraceae bacterium]|nr:ABC transporter permease [Lachnospiraceae bacterium]